jgi:hypothetical protein
MPENHVSAELSVESRAAIMAAIATIREELPFLYDLSPEVRRQLPKMGDGSRAFVEKTLEIAKQNPDFLARSFDLEEFERDVALYNALSPVLIAVSQLHELLDDTLLAVGSDAYTAALEAYAYAYAKRAGNTQGLDELKALMGKRFARGRSSTALPPVE